MTTTAQLQQLQHEVTTLQAMLIPRVQRLEHLVDYLLVQERIAPADVHTWLDQFVSKLPIDTLHRRKPEQMLGSASVLTNQTHA